MIKIAGYWDVWENAIREHEVHWRFMLKHFGVDTMYMTPITGIDKFITGLDNTEVKLLEIETIQEAINTNPSLTPVLVDENGTTTVDDFIHPTNVLYIFGRVGISLIDIFGDQYQSIRVPSWASDPNTSLSLLHPHQAASIVLYNHRINQI